MPGPHAYQLAQAGAGASKNELTCETLAAKIFINQEHIEFQGLRLRAEREVGILPDDRDCGYLCIR